MQIFLSHSGRQKPLVREVKKYLPDHLGLWIDEEKLQFGDTLTDTIKSSIVTETDYVLLFLDEFAAESEWVKKEIQWAIEAEKKHLRTILLPIVIDENAFQVLEREKLQDRKYLRLKDFQESAVIALSNQIASELFALVCRDLSLIRNPEHRTTPMSTIKDAESFVREQTKLVQKAVFPHRSSNPIATGKLWEVLNANRQDLFRRSDFDTIMGTILQRNLIPGLVFDGYEAYLSEEHASWKREVYQDRKLQIARAACKLIKNGMSMFIDAGSTTEEIVQIICKKIKSRALTSITVATTSINIADMFSDCAVEMGFDKSFTAIKLYIPGGLVRPNTQAIVPVTPQDNSQFSQLSKLIDGFDICFVGVNGIDSGHGLTTHDNEEADNKLAILKEVKNKYVVGDSSKVGIVLDRVIGNLNEDIKLIIDDDGNNADLKQLVQLHDQNIILA